MRECFLITTYCDTAEKITVLKDTLNSLEKYNLDVCIHAHYPLPIDIQQNVQYYIYDKSNPILPLDRRSIIMWRKHHNHQLNILKFDYGYTVASQWKLGLLFLENINYDIVHILNYDTVITDEIIINSKKIKDYSGVFYLNAEENLNLLFATVRPSDYLLEDISMEDYIGMDEYWYAEKYLYDKLKGNNLYLTDNIEDKLRHQKNEFHQFDLDKCSIHAGQKINWINGEKIYTNKFSFMLYNINTIIDLKIFIDDNLYLHESINEFRLIDTDIMSKDINQSFGYYDINEFISGNKMIQIHINDEMLGDDITSKFCLSAIESLE